MKVLIVCLLAVTFVSSAVVNQDKRRQIFGICVEMCGAGCPPGTICKSNGCGHTCQPITTAVKRAGCSLLSCLTDHCAFGFSTAPDACPCTCNPPRFDILIG
ncbi:uncharacterized protein LOC131951119 isoform X3 [Physella acuta]|uniref:uncharacterized protein LOC131951119 isoform X3 n=1 Tax=Physella acuta TaxID=109671 RepID=UPI0027DB23A1|nr:uncharacterized protein LOC131951119 isoform X3 [Physella acuta]